MICDAALVEEVEKGGALPQRLGAGNVIPVALQGGRSFGELKAECKGRKTIVTLREGTIKERAMLKACPHYARNGCALNPHWLNAHSMRIDRVHTTCNRELDKRLNPR